MRRLAILAGVVLLVLSCMAQECEVRRISISAIDDKLAPIGSLTEKNLRIEFGGRPARLTSLKPIPYGRIVLLLDESGSMMGGNTSVASAGWGVSPPLNTNEPAKAPLEREVAAVLLRAVPQRRGLAIMTFATDSAIVSDFDTPREQALQRVAALPPPKSRTALLNALLAAAKKFDPAQPGDSIVVLTDGEDNDSHASAREIAKTLAAANVRVFVVLLPDGLPAAPEEVAGPDSLRTIAHETGGAFVMVHDIDTSTPQKLAPDIANVLASWLDGGYDAVLELPVQPTKPKSIDIKTAGLPHKPRLLQFNYSRWVLPCTPDPSGGLTK